MSSRSWSAVRASASAMPGPSSRSSTGSTERRTRERSEAGVLVVGVRPPLDAVGAAGRLGLRTGQVEQAAARRPPPLLEVTAHPLQRAAARSPGQPEQHRLGLVVEGVPQQHARGRRSAAASCARAAYLASRAPASIPGRSGIDRDPDRRRLVDPERRPSGPPPARCAPRDPSCRPWSTTAPTTRVPTRDPRRRWPPAAPGSRPRRSRPPAPAAPPPSPRAAPYGDAAPPRGPGRAPSASRGRGRSRAPGRGSPPWRGGSPGWPRRR